MSQENGVPEPAPEEPLEDIGSVVAIKQVLDLMLADESLTLLERRNAFESLRVHIDDAIDQLDVQRDKDLLP